jgi:hypothetical protein
MYKHMETYVYLYFHAMQEHYFRDNHVCFPAYIRIIRTSKSCIARRHTYGGRLTPCGRVWDAARRDQEKHQLQGGDDDSAACSLQLLQHHDALPCRESCAEMGGAQHENTRLSSWKGANTLACASIHTQTLMRVDLARHPYDQVTTCPFNVHMCVCVYYVCCFCVPAMNCDVHTYVRMRPKYAVHVSYGMHRSRSAG